MLVLGPTVFLLQTYVQNTGAYLSDIVNKTFNLYAYEPTDWIGGWTLLYMGLVAGPGRPSSACSSPAYLARPHDPKFVCGVLFVPGLHPSCGDGVRRYRHPWSCRRASPSWPKWSTRDSSVALFAFLEHFPLGSVISLVAVLMVVVLLRHLGRLRRAGGGHASLQRQGPLAALAADILVGADGRGGHRPVPRRWPQGCAANRDHRQRAAILHRAPGVDLGPVQALHLDATQARHPLTRR